MNKIEPQTLAHKIESGCFEGFRLDKTLTARRRMELLWFLQAVSMQRDGLEALARHLLKAHPKQFQFPPEKSIYSHESHLASFLFIVCTNKNTDLHAPEFCPQLIPLLLDHLGEHAAAIGKTIAQTEITKTVFRELEFACQQNIPVRIVGESRIGKTTPAAVWCAMRPGRARLVTVPESNRERDFLMAHADAFGIEYTAKTSTHNLRLEVKYVHVHSRPFVCYDEAHFLVPIRYSKTTPPTRLEYVRNQVIDRELDCAFFATPQSYKQTLDEFVKVTDYPFHQWLGRMAPTVILPTDLGHEDLMAVARNHFPDMPEPYLKLIAAQAMASEGYLKNVEITCKRARFLASERGAARVNIEDVKAAIAYMSPAGGNAAPPARNGRQSSAPIAPDPEEAPVNRLSTAPAVPIRRSLKSAGAALSTA